MRFLSILAFAAAASAGVVERGNGKTVWKTKWGWKTKYPKTCGTATVTSTSTYVEVVPTTVYQWKKQYVTVTSTETDYVTKWAPPKYITVYVTKYEEKWGWKTETDTVTAPCTSVYTKVEEKWGWKTATVTAPCTSVSTKTEEQWGWKTATVTAPCTSVSTVYEWKTTEKDVWKTDTVTAPCTSVSTVYEWKTTEKDMWMTQWDTTTITDTITNKAACTPSVSVSTCTVTSTVSYAAKST